MKVRAKAGIIRLLRAECALRSPGRARINEEPTVRLGISLKHFEFTKQENIFEKKKNSKKQFWSRGMSVYKQYGSTGTEQARTRGKRREGIYVYEIRKEIEGRKSNNEGDQCRD